MNEKIVMARVVKKDPEEKIYLICIRDRTDGDMWDLCEGRTAAYTTLKGLIENGDVDLDESFVLVETLKLQDRKSVYQFMKFAEGFYEDNFDIEDYVIGDKLEEKDIDEGMIPDQTITSAFEPEDRLSMEEMIGQDVNTKDVD